MCTIPGATRESYLETFLQTDGFCDGTDTDHYMEPEAAASSEQPNCAIANPAAQNMIYATVLNRIVMTITVI